jgi:hypothetical protein
MRAAIVLKTQKYGYSLSHINGKNNTQGAKKESQASADARGLAISFITANNR